MKIIDPTIKFCHFWGFLNKNIYFSGALQCSVAICVWRRRHLKSVTWLCIDTVSSKFIFFMWNKEIIKFQLFIMNICEGNLWQAMFRYTLIMLDFCRKFCDSQKTRFFPVFRHILVSNSGTSRGICTKLNYVSY